MHIAILDEELPYPMTSGKRIRTLNLLRRLAKRHRLTYICHRNADAKEAVVAGQHFRSLGIETIVVDRAVPPRSGTAFHARLARNLLSSLPYSVESHASPELSLAVREYAALNHVDLWHCEWTPYAQTMRSLAGARWLVMAHNVESLIWQRMAETERNAAKRWYIRRQWKKYERFEQWAYTSADRAVAVSPDDARLMRERFDARAVEVVDNGVDVSYFMPGDALREPKTILFLGSLDWRPNIDAVQLLFDSIYPSVLASEREAKLLIVGRNPPDWMRECARSRGIELHGSVADVRPFIARAGVMAVPLRIGGGSRLKILESLASGLPVVSTRIGAEGLELEPGRHLDVIEGVESMADALVAAIRQPDRARAQAEAGRSQVLSRYDWDSLAERLDAVWQRCLSEPLVKRAA